MCGISALLQVVKNVVKNDSKKYHANTFKDHLDKLRSRGPDDIRMMNIKHDNLELFMGFSRLSINDLSERGMQPMTDETEGIILICNGEIYNHEDLKRTYKLETKSGSDCEVVLRLYEKLNGKIEEMIQLIDGEFAFVLYDKIKRTLYASRDRYGVRPLYMCYDQMPKKESKIISFTSELKACTYLPFGEHVRPGVIVKICMESESSDTVCMEEIMYHSVNDIRVDERLTEEKEEEREVRYMIAVREALSRAVEKRVRTSERKVCCLLSGGLDSSLVAALTSQYMRKIGSKEPLETFSIGLKGSPDLEYAKVVARHIQSKHYSIELSESDFLGAIEETIRIIESYDTTTVRASVGNYLVSKYIKEHTDNKVVLCGDYSDEVCGGYKYFNNAPSAEAFDEECRRLVSDIHYFDSLRSDRSISSQGLEVRSPFSDPEFVDCYLSIPPYFRTISPTRMEKYLLRKSFEKDCILPSNVLWRRKEAFSDGVSDKSRSWHVIIKEHVNRMISDDEYEEYCEQPNLHNRPRMKESYYYRKIFERYYGQYVNIVPYYWLPKWCSEGLNDPSAREL
jgi:asparagine synthase (glutamine-hydrolysing)